MKAVPSRIEFIALMAMLFATIAFSIDSMLPALPEIGAALTPQDPNRAQLVITSFMLGMGVGTLFTGPLSDRFGRKPVILAGVALYIVMSAVAAQAQTLETLLAARVIEGLGAAGPRVVALAIVRDLFTGRAMARIMSFVMMVFTLFPAIAPTLGAGIIALSSWRGIFWAFILFAGSAALWMTLRLPETLPREKRRPFSLPSLMAALREVLSHPVVQISIGVQALCAAMMFSMLSSVQQIYDVTYGQGENFPIWFGLTAVLASTGSFANSRLVMRLGMRFIVTSVITMQIGASAIAFAVFASGLTGPLAFAAFILWQVSVFFMAGLTMGNINAIAMEPMGHIAGLAASVIGAVSTVLAVVMAVPVGQMFDGTALPLAMGVFIEAVVALILMRSLARREAREPI